ncbi:hypothetical protein FVD63_15400, partial [Enterococcus faecium]|nr:hypothetical protein [Enterococcus faecium]
MSLDLSFKNQITIIKISAAANIINSIAIEILLDLSTCLGHILEETAKAFFILLMLLIPVGLDSESNDGYDVG